MIGILLAVLISISYGQENLPLKFKDYEPAWIDFVQLDQYPLNELGRYVLRGAPKLIDDSLYIFYNIKHFGYNGIIAEKRNINYGSLYWRFYRDTLVEKARIAISRVYMYEKEIELVLFDEDHYIDDTTIPDWAAAHSGKMILGKNNGSILGEKYTNHLDSNNIVIKTIGDDFYDSGNTSLKLLKTENGYREIFFLRYPQSYYITDIDTLGHLIKKDTMTFTTPYPVVSHRLYDMNDSTFFSVIVSTEDKNVYDDKIEIVYRQIDHNMNILKTVDIASQIPDVMKDANTFRADNGYFIVASGFQAEDNSYANARYYLFDDKGMLKDRIVHTITANDKIEYGWLFPIVDIKNERLILTLSQQDTRETGTYFKLFTSNGDKLDIMRKFEVQGIQDHFRVKYATMLQSGDLLMYIGQFDWDANPMYPYPINWYSWMLMSKDDIVSNKVVLNKPKDDIMVYPNPTSGKVNIKSSNEIKSINVINNNAKVVFFNKGNKELDLTSLPKGIYNVMIEKENGAMQIKRIIVE